MKHAFQLLVGALLALTLAACQAPDHTGATATSMQLKTYSVPPQKSLVLANTLNHALASENSRIRVSQPFPGTLLVYAPPGIQDSISEVIDALGKAADKLDGPVSLQVHFWVVDARPGKGADDPALNPLATTLDHIRASLGPSHFVLDESVVATTMLDQQGQIATGFGRQFVFTARAGQDGTINLHVIYNDSHVNGQGIGNLSTTVAMTAGQYVVMAQAPNPVSGGQPDRLAGAAPTMRLLVVSVDRPVPAPH